MNIEEFSSLEHFLNKSLRGQMVIAFRSNSYCFWEIWAVPGSIPRVGTWFFFFVQIDYFKFFMYVCLSYNDKKQSKLSSNLLKIHLNFWTVCVGCNTKKGGNLGLCTQTDLHLLDQRLPDALLLPTVRVFSDVTKEELFLLLSM